MIMREKGFWVRGVMSAFVMAAVLGFTACGAAGNGTASYDKAMSEAVMTDNAGADASIGGINYASEEMLEPQEAEAWEAEAGEGIEMSTQTAANSAYYDSRKLIRTVNLDVETKEFDQMLASIEAQVAALGGYIEQMNTYNGSSYSGSRANRSSSLTARIPKKSLDSFLQTVAETGNVISRSEYVEDVTLAYVDMESRRNTLQTEQERLLAFLEKAESLEDIITLEERLSEVRYQLEKMESQLRTYDNKVDFATVNMGIQEVKELTPVPVEEETVWDRLAGGFMGSLMNVKDGIVDLFIGLVVHIPYFVVWAVVIVVIIKVFRRVKRRIGSKREAKLHGSPEAPSEDGTMQDGQGRQNGQ